MQELQNSFSQSKENLHNTNEVFTVAALQTEDLRPKMSNQVNEDSSRMLHPSQARINMGVFGEFNVTITSQNKSQE
jgi:hypothetical protein